MGAWFLASSLLFFGVTLGSGTSLRGLVEGLLLTPLKMPGVALLPLRLPTAGLLNVAASLILALVVVRLIQRGRLPAAFALVQGGYGLVGAVFLVGQAQLQFKYLLPWAWLALLPEPGVSGSSRPLAFSRVCLCLMVAWQSLQAYPIAGTQVMAATLPLVLVYTVCLAQSLRVAHGLGWLRAPRAHWAPRMAALVQALALVGLLAFFANWWCRLPEARRHYASLEPLGLKGSRLVRMDAETTELYRSLTAYLEAECDTFVTYPGINSLYFWTGKRPPTQLNSTGWGQLSHAQQEFILGSLQGFKRPLVVVVEASMKTWGLESAQVIRPLTRYVLEDCRPIKRLGRFLIFVPRLSEDKSRSG
jgi:hypothetical protein